MNQLLDHTEQCRGTAIPGWVWSKAVHHKDSKRKWEQCPCHIRSARNSEALVIIQYSSSQWKNSCHKHFDFQLKWLWQNNLHSEIKRKCFLAQWKQSTGLCFWLDTQEEVFDLGFPLWSGFDKEQAKIIFQCYWLNYGRYVRHCFCFLTTFSFGC